MPVNAIGPDAARDVFGMDEAYSVETLTTKLPDLIAGQPALFYSSGFDAACDALISNAINSVRNMVRSGLSAPALTHDVRAIVDNMRLIKDAEEVAVMRRAAEISGRAHMRAMRACKPGMAEYEIEAELLHEFRRGGSEYPAYGSIVAGGANACVLHYVSNDHTLNDGDLILIDAGCELHSYASDITRTWPVNGKFSGPQRDLYEVVLAAQAAAIAETRVGTPYNRPHEAAVRVLAQGMIDCGLLQGSLDAAIELGDKREGGYFRYYMHRTGHWLGLDVHDAGPYKHGDAWLPLAAGNVVTVEPGIYVRPASDVPQAFWNIGIRIEDDALVTPDGCDILTRDCIKTISDIEALMRDAR
jgi:Xaa-Pro aminopeptidase